MVGEIARLVKLRPDERESRDVIMDQKYWIRNMDQKYIEYFHHQTLVELANTMIMASGQENILQDINNP